MENDISINIKKVMIVFLLCFISIISYITYFELFKAQDIAKSQYNKRLWAIRNEVLRGTIYDRNMKPLTKSDRVNTETQKREYTGGALFAHALGYVDIKYGMTGLENTYDPDLMHAQSQSLIEYIKNKGKAEEKIGRNLKTTLDYNVQKTAFDMLGDNRGAVVALNPKTGEVLALVSKPSFDPNDLANSWADLNKEGSNRPLLNRATSGLYPPGSTFKTVTSVSALENIKGITTRRFEDKGKIYFNNKYSLNNFGGEVLGNIGFKEAYYESSNAFFGTIGMELGNDKLKETAEKFYFNKNIPSEGLVIENSKFPKVPKTEPGNIAQTAIGQGADLATPMEMALVASTIANDGVMMRPSLVKEVIDPKGNLVRSIEPQILSNVTSKDNAAIMKDYMRAVVTNGTGGNAEVPGIKVAGKTGTADHNDEPNSIPHSWFIGFAPYDNPQIAVAVIVEDGGQGGIAAAKIAGQVMKSALKK
ncbi:peptidoglycan D,D-transpeptidase FtsI family protein [Clostridium omnivorum]|uniref:Penicillin-binding protein n=1 Tax=Clostridium omnivorum TaxID=1604902 RepID=A0ABQ5N387_9CLOT|nr:penicillin-binding transpeptidase domain-containing protein [Clostridium sp. E14]GLC29656.1 penicillin-binding protein [Clostridium sp. E14]